VGGQNFFVEQGAGQNMKLVIDWVSAPAGGTSVQTQLITSSGIDNASISSSLVMIDFGVLPVSMFFAGYRQIQPLPRSASWRRFLSLRIITAGRCLRRIRVVARPRCGFGSTGLCGRFPNQIGEF